MRRGRRSGMGGRPRPRRRRTRGVPGVSPWGRTPCAASARRGRCSPWEQRPTHGHALLGAPSSAPAVCPWRTTGPGRVPRSWIRSGPKGPDPEVMGMTLRQWGSITAQYSTLLYCVAMAVEQRQTSTRQPSSVYTSENGCLGFLSSPETMCTTRARWK